MFINVLMEVWKLLCGRLLAAGGSGASGWLCPSTPTKVDGFNCGTSQCPQRSSGFSIADVTGDGPGEVAWALLGRKVGRRVAMVLSGLKAFVNADFKGSHIL